MQKSATDLMQEIMVSTVLDAVDAWKGAAGGLSNVLARELGAVHRNATFADLPKPVQDALMASVRTAFNRLLKEGYAVMPSNGAPPPPQRPMPPRDGPRGGQPPRPRGPQRPRAAAPIVEVRGKPRGPSKPKGE